MKSLLLFFIISSVCADVAAQKMKTFRVKPGEKVVEKIPREEMYSYPEFINGTVHFKNNTYAVAKMNYNALFGEMQFADTNGDTISLADEKTIELIAINKDTFYWSKGYLKLLVDGGNVKLANKRFIRFLNREKMNGFGESTGGSIETYSAMSSTILKDLVASEVLTLGVDNVLYIGDKFNNFFVASKKTVLELYANKGIEMEMYLKDNKVNFKSEEDLKKLVSHFKTKK